MAPPISNGGGVPIIDIRRNNLQFSLRDEIHKQLRPAPGMEKKMPTMLLYDEKGLRLFEEISYLEEYYLTNAEIEVLEKYSDHIAERIPAGSLIVELGSGNLRKISILLRALERAKREVDYYALDLSKSELQRTFQAASSASFEFVRCHGLYGTYEDGLEWLKSPKNAKCAKCIMSMGSSIGNFDRDEAAQFLAEFASILGPKDLVIIGLDACQDKDKVYHGYNDREGKTHEFVLNGLVHTNELLGRKAFNLEEWEVIGEYDCEAGRHQAFYSPKKDISLDDIHFQAGERVRIEESYKYSSVQSSRLWERAGLMERAVFGDSTGEYHIHMLSATMFDYPLDPKRYAERPVPSLYEYEQLWAAWDVVTRSMIPEEELLSKPIKLRNACIFYLGHIPTFLDIHLARVTDGILTGPSYYPRIFERGVDPDVDNPEHCHAHSEIPDSWPSVDEIITFQKDVRQRISQLYKTSNSENNHKIGRTLWLGFEHEAMHLETLLYMLLQSEKTVSPPGARPDFEALAKQAKIDSVPNEWIMVPSSQVTIGLDDPENYSGPDRYFGWDNEKPARLVHVPAFEAKARGITNGDYARYLSETKKAKHPASWTTVNNSHIPSQPASLEPQLDHGAPYMNDHGVPLTNAFLDGKAVRTVYGPVPLAYALDWPVMASYDELIGCAKWMDGRIPTLEEVRSIYNYVDELTMKDAGNVIAQTIPAVNGHLSNDGVEESPPSHPSRQAISSAEKSLDPTTVFTNLEGYNVGFKHFHPMSITQNGSKLSGQADMGGVWEWTSSVLEKHEGFEPMDAYPAYTADFFDGKHNVILGGSWATHPRIAGRKSFVNWYQRNYPYVWAGARIVRDV